MKIYPSLISADLLNLQSTLKMLDSVCDGYHLDVMDNHFVPNLTWGNAFIKAIAQATKLPLDVHLMVDCPEQWLPNLPLRTNDVVTLHAESVKDLDKALAEIKVKSWLPGLALSPKMEVETIEHFLPEIHQVTVMTVEPGFSGQQFMPSMLPKIQKLVHIKKAKKLHFLLTVDGGVNTQNIGELANFGVDEVAAAGAIFFGKDPVAAVEELRDAANQKIFKS